MEVSKNGPRIPGMPPGVLASYGAVLAMAVVTIAAVWLATHAMVERAGARELQDTRNELENYAKTLAGHIERTIGTVDRSLLAIKRDVERGRRVWPDAELATEHRAHGDFVSVLSVVDARGDVIASSISSKGVNLAGRQHFIALRETGDAGLVLGLPVRGQASGLMTMHAARRLNARDGSFRGIASAGLNLDYFAGFYRGIDLGSGGSIEIIGLDGLPRIGEGARGAPSERVARYALLVDRVRRGETRGTDTGVEGADGPLIRSHYALEGYPLVVTVAKSEAAALRGIVQYRRHAYAYAGGVTLLILALMASAHFLLRRQRGTQAALSGSEARFRALTELTSDWYWEADAEYRFSLMSAGIAHWRMRVPADYLGKRRWELAFLSPLDGGWERHQETVQARQPFRDFVVRHTDFDGNVGYASVSGEPVADAHGRHLGYRGVGRDVTAEIRLQQRLKLQHRVSAILANASSAQAAVTEVLRAACETFDWQWGARRLTDGTTLSCAETWCVPELEWSAFARATREIVYPRRPGGIMDRALQSGEPQWVAAEDGGMVRRMSIATAAGLRMLITAPVSCGGHAIGALEFSSSRLVPVGVMWGHESAITAADDTFLDIIGYSRHDLDTGAIDWVALTPAEYLHLDEAGIQQALVSGGFTVPYQKEFIRKDGTRVPVLLVCAFIPDAPGDWMGYVVDLSRHPRHARIVPSEAVAPISPVPDEFYRRLVGELVNERSRLHAMLDNSGSPIWAVDADFRMLSANQAFQDVQRLISGRIMEVGESLMGPEFPEADRRQWSEWYGQAFAGATVTVPTSMVNGGRAYHFDHILTPMRDTHGAIYGVSVVSHDVSRRMDAEDALRSSESRFRTLAAASPLGVFLTDATGQVVYANERLADMLAINTADLMGSGALQRLHPDDTARVVEAWTTARAQGTDLQTEFRVRLPNGQERSLHTWISALRAGDAFTGFVGSVEDATERLAMARRVQQRERMESLGTLAGGIAHDFNNMLGIVLGYTELAMTEPDVPDALRDELAEIRTASLRARDLVQQILTFSRRGDDVHTPVDLSALARESGRLLRATLPARIAFAVRVPDTPIMVRGAASALQQVMVNLCVNAEHALRNHPDPILALEITVDHRGESPVARLVVRDNGHGMNSEIASRVFEPFFTTKPVGEGSGMGLSVVHGTILAHRGVIHVESRPGNGTAFHIELPLADDSPDVPVAAVTAARGSGRILLVEDEPALARAIATMLRRSGYTVTVCTDGMQALQHVERERPLPDLVLSDVAMPRLTGDRLAREIRARYPTLPVVLMTGFSRDVSADDVTDGTVRAVLAKPVDIPALLSLLQQLLSATIPA